MIAQAYGAPAIAAFRPMVHLIALLTGGILGAFRTLAIKFKRGRIHQNKQFAQDL